MNHDEVYENICKDRFAQLETRSLTGFNDIIREIKSLEKRLFIDNGDECIQSVLNRHERWIRIWGWLAVTIGGILSTVAAAIIIHKLLV